MAKADGRIEQGQSIKSAFSASKWNDLCDAADIVHGRNGGTSGTPQATGDTNLLRVRLAADLNSDIWPGTWVFMDLDGVGDIDAKALKNSPRLSMFARPIAAGGKDKVYSSASYNAYKFFGMARTGGAPGDIITVQVSGAVFCYVEIRHKWHGYATFPYSPHGTTVYGGGSTIVPENGGSRPFSAVPESAVSGAMRLVWWDDTNFATAAASGTGVLCPAIVAL